MEQVTPRKRLTRAEAKAQTRALLLDAAARTFARKGFEGASVEEIAESAGFSVGAVYSNFDGKEQLFVELMSNRASERVADAARIVRECQDNGERPLQALNQLLINGVDKDDDFTALQSEFWLYAIRHPEAMKVLAERLRGPKESLVEVTQRAVDQHAPATDVPMELLTTVLYALFDGLARQRRIDPASVPDDLFGQALRWIFAGIGANTGS